MFHCSIPSDATFHFEKTFAGLSPDEQAEVRQAVNRYTDVVCEYFSGSESEPTFMRQLLTLPPERTISLI